jgi:transcription initiation factor IIE alpha subunit
VDKIPLNYHIKYLFRGCLMSILMCTDSKSWEFYLRVMAFIQEHKKFSVSELAEALEISLEKAREILNNLNGLILTFDGLVAVVY